MANDKSAIGAKRSNFRGRYPTATRFSSRSAQRPTDALAFSRHLPRAPNSATADSTSLKPDQNSPLVRLPDGSILELKYRPDLSEKGSNQLVPNYASCDIDARRRLNVEAQPSRDRYVAPDSEKYCGTLPPGHFHIPRYNDLGLANVKPEYNQIPSPISLPSETCNLMSRAHSDDVTDDETEDDEPLKEPQLGGDDDEDQRKVRFELRQIKVQEIPEYLYFMFEALSQKGLKRVLQAWIRECHPGKQGTHPYNGGITTKDLPKGSPDFDKENPGKHTAPIYWPNQEGYKNRTPSACRHREPHHVRKWERQCLGPHLLCLEDRYAREGFDFSLQKLKRATEGICRKNRNDFPDKGAEVLDGIYRARQKYMSFGRGECDGTSYMNLFMTDPAKAAATAAKRTVKADADNEADKRRKRVPSAHTDDSASMATRTVSTSSSFSSFSSGCSSESESATFNLRNLHDGMEIDCPHVTDRNVSAPSILSKPSGGPCGEFCDCHPLTGYNATDAENLSRSTSGAFTNSDSEGRILYSPSSTISNGGPFARNDAHAGWSTEGDVCNTSLKTEFGPNSDPIGTSGLPATDKNSHTWNGAMSLLYQHPSMDNPFVPYGHETHHSQAVNDFGGDEYLFDDPSWFSTQWDFRRGGGLDHMPPATTTDAAPPTIPGGLLYYEQDNWQASPRTIAGTNALDVNNWS